MKKGILAAGIVALGILGAGYARGASFDGDHVSPTQLKRLAQAAHTPEQYKNLAITYAKQQSYFLQQAAEEKVEWQRRSQNIVSINAKYPRPVDSARYLYEYYVYKAAEAGSLSAKYDQMAGTTTH
jgi:hypothetical protein